MAILAALQRRRFSLARIGRLLGKDIEFQTAVGNLALIYEDRQVPGIGDWIPRTSYKGGNAKNYLYQNLLRDDEGILKRFDNGDVLVHGRDSGKGHHYLVSPAPERAAKFICKEVQCQRRLKGNPDPNTRVWCYHVDNRRHDAGYTRLTDVQAPLFPATPTAARPQTGRRERSHSTVREVPKITRKTAVATATPKKAVRSKSPKVRAAEPDDEAGPPSPPSSTPPPQPRQQVRGARSQPFVVPPVNTPETPTPSYHGVRLRAGAVDFSVASVPVGGLKRLLEDFRMAIGQDLRIVNVDGNPDVTPSMVFEALRELGRGVVHEVDAILGKAFPEWNEMDENQRRAVRSQFSQAIIRVDFKNEAAKRGWLKQPSLLDRRKFRYGVKT